MLFLSDRILQPSYSPMTFQLDVTPLFCHVRSSSHPDELNARDGMDESIEGVRIDHSSDKSDMQHK